MNVPQKYSEAVLAALRLVPSVALTKLARHYAELDEDIAARQPVCNASGRCCHFDALGHRLYVSTLELAYFLSHTGLHTAAGALPPASQASAPLLKFPLPLFKEDGGFHDGCPWQIDRLCTAREARPLGCRIYFCDTTAESWQRDRYEYYHKKITGLHREFEVPYYYMEWRTALGQLND